MAYFIFLKSLRSLGEFGKNPHVKIPPKSPCANFQSIGIFINSIFYQKKKSSSTFGPIGQWPAGPPSLLAPSGQEGRASSPGRVLPPPSPSSLTK
jgi:hypothetical protein